MAIVDSRLKTGKLTLGPIGSAQEFSCQATNVKVTPSYDTDGDPLEVLCGDTILPTTTRSDELAITAIQDFDNPNGFVAYSWAHDLEPVPFTWQPNPTSPVYSGQVQVRAVEVGGDVNKRNTTEATWTVVGKTNVTAAGAGALAITAAEANPKGTDRRRVTLSWTGVGEAGVTVVWKDAGTPETYTGAQGSHDHVYTSADDGENTITVTDAARPTVSKTVKVTTPYTG